MELNDTIRAFYDRLAQEGFIAFAPDLHHGRVAVTIPEAEALDANVDEARREIAAPAAHAGLPT